MVECTELCAVTAEPKMNSRQRRPDTKVTREIHLQGNQTNRAVAPHDIVLLKVQTNTAFHRTQDQL